jgi:O-acetyl-ADP-ribose deacetylase (regulator of RNase III)
MIKYFEGTVFNTDAMAIVNTVNCDGFMGAGLALEFALRYPQMLVDYEQKCKKSSIKIGFVDYYKDKDIMIINFPTKNSFKFQSNIKWIEEGLKNFRQTYKERNISSVAFPKLGCSNGGLNWVDVKQIMEKYLSDLDIDVYICEDTLKIAQGKEKEMLDLFNNMPIEEIATITKLNQKQITAIINKRPYSRFWLVGKTSGIGKTSYNKLFNYFYNNPSSQMKLF